MSPFDAFIDSFTNVHVPLPEIGLRLFAAAVLGLAVGWERERNAHAAGLRTLCLVALGAAGFMLATIEIAYSLEQNGMIEFDPARVIGGVVGGIGFLGAGAIIKSGQEIHGLTTAAGIWVTAAVGLAAGAGLYPIAIGLTVLAIVILVALKQVKGELRAEKSAPEDRP